MQVHAVGNLFGHPFSYDRVTMVEGFPEVFTFALNTPIWSSVRIVDRGQSVSRDLTRLLKKF